MAGPEPDADGERERPGVSFRDEDAGSSSRHRLLRRIVDYRT